MVVHLEVKVCIRRVLFITIIILSTTLDAPLPSENRISMIPNGGPSTQNKSATWVGSAWSSVPNSGALGKPPPGRDPKSRARSRDYLKQ